jgi:hypothetical protein
MSSLDKGVILNILRIGGTLMKKFFRILLIGMVIAFEGMFGGYHVLSFLAGYDISVVPWVAGCMMGGVIMLVGMVTNMLWSRDDE